MQEDSGYKVNYDTAVLADDIEDAMDIVASGTHKGKKVAGVLHVTSLGGFSAELAQDYKKYVHLGNVEDKDFNDSMLGDIQLYTKCTISGQYQRGFESANWGSTDTLCLNSVVVYTKDVPRKVYKVMRKGITKALR